MHEGNKKSNFKLAVFAEETGMKMKKLVVILYLLLVIVGRVNAQWTPFGGPESGSVSILFEDSVGIFGGHEFGAGILLTTDYGKSWIPKTKGLECWDINCFARNENRIFAGSNRGIYYSDDHGENWIKVVNPFMGYFKTSGIISQNDTIIATSSIGTFISTDNGTQWRHIMNGLDTVVVNLLHKGENFIYAGTRSDGVFRSSDNGTTWIKCSGGLPGYEIRCISELNGILFAGVDAGLYISDNYGENWKLVEGIPAYSAYLALISHDNHIYAGTSSGRIFVSENNGNDWSVFSRIAVDEYVTNISIYDDIFFANLNSISGMYTSKDYGQTWEKSPGINGSLALSMLYKWENIYLGTSSGLYISYDNGKSWKISSDGLPVDYMNRVTSIGENLLATDSYDIFISEDKGMTWRNISPFSYCLVNDIQVFEDQILLVTPESIFSSADMGRSWRNIDNGIHSGSSRFTILVNQNDLYCGTSDGIYYSGDSGQTWEQRINGLRGHIVELACNDKYIFAGADWSFSGIKAEIFRSSDNGENWEEVADNLFSAISISDLETFGDIILAGVAEFSGIDGGLFISYDNGSTWEHNNEGLPDQKIIEFYKGRERIYGLILNNGIWQRPFYPPTKLDEEQIIPAEFILSQNYPNPFNPATKIRFALPVDSKVRVTVYNTIGQEVTTLLNGEKQAGYHHISFNAASFASGVYFYTISAKGADGQNFRTTKKMMLVK